MMAPPTNNNDGSCSGSRKRPATGGAYDCPDPAIGLNAGGKIFYTHKSTLTNGSSYFAARFGGSFGAESSFTDENGLEVYFIDACPELFERILNFLRRGIPTWPKNLYKEDPVLHKRLVGEAEYFGIDSMLAALQSRPIVIDPDGSGKDILYWLGTVGGGEEYKNPLDVGAVSLGGTCYEDLEDQRETDPEGFESRKNFTQNRPLCGDSNDFNGSGDSFPDPDWYCTSSSLLNCDHSLNGDCLNITFQEISVRPSHYSLRYGNCRGMTCWDFEASVDGEHWISLHKSRGDKSIAAPSEEDSKYLTKSFLAECKDIADAATRQSIATSFVEKELRHVWRVEGATKFYRYFRLKGAGDDDVHDVGCMHGVGFELYGEVEEV